MGKRHNIYRVAHKTIYFSLLTFSKKIITDSLFSEILQIRPVEVV